nr:MAG TPA: hypothetical protein [Caudoviricetes sp.]
MATTINVACTSMELLFLATIALCMLRLVAL